MLLLLNMPISLPVVRPMKSAAPAGVATASATVDAAARKALSYFRAFSYLWVFSYMSDLSEENGWGNGRERNSKARRHSLYSAEAGTDAGVTELSCFEAGSP
ncbi:MAG: hypothetical protein ABIF28_17360 [Pseudomonadota bacterium]